MSKDVASSLATALQALLADKDEKSAEQNLKDFKNVGFEQKGTKIILPMGMTFSLAQKWLKRRQEEEETEVQVVEEVDAFPLDGAYALAKALERIYGWSNLRPTPGFWGSTPPAMICLESGIGTSVQVPWGRMVFPGIEGHIDTSFTKKDGRMIFQLVATVKRKHEKHIHELADVVRQIVREESIYRGKAIRITYRNSEGTREKFSVNHCPKFIDTAKVNPDELIFSDHVQKMVETCLYNPIEKTEACRKHRIPLKRGIMLEGPYGTGKTLTAWVVAKKCEENGWTFIYLDDVRDLDQALEFARMYEPSVVFAEDLDRAVGKDRTSDTDRILNTLDGVNSKTRETIVVLTSNEVKNIHKAMIRPGRIDTVVPVRSPDRNAICRLIRLYGRELVDATDTDLFTAVEPLEGTNAAVIREAVERAKLGALAHSENGDLTVTANDIGIASQTMRHHLDLLNDPPQVPGSAFEEIVSEFKTALKTEFKSELQPQLIQEVTKEVTKIING